MEEHISQLIPQRCIYPPDNYKDGEKLTQIWMTSTCRGATQTEIIAVDIPNSKNVYQIRHRNVIPRDPPTYFMDEWDPSISKFIPCDEDINYKGKVHDYNAATKYTTTAIINMAQNINGDIQSNVVGLYAGQFTIVTEEYVVEAQSNNS